MLGSGLDDSKVKGIDYSQLVMREINSKVPCTGENFKNGAIPFEWTCGKPYSALLYRSYFRIGVKVSAYDKEGNVYTVRKPLLSDRLALAPYACDSLFSNMTFRMADAQICKMNSNNPQAAALRRRLIRSNAYLKTLGGVMGNGDSFSERQRRICDGSLYSPEMDDLDTRRFTHIVTDEVKCTIAVADGVATLSSANAKFENAAIDVQPGDYVVVDGRSYEVAVRTSDTQLVLKGLYGAGVAVVDTKDCYIVKAKKSSLRYDENTQSFYMLWQPPLACFYGEMGHNPLPHSNYQIELSHNTNFNTSFFECLNSGTSADGVTYKAPDANKFSVEITSLTFYLATISKTVLDYPLKILSDFQVIPQTISANQATYNFTCNPTTNAIAVWIQDASNGSDASYPPTVFKAKEDLHLRIQNLQISYANQTKSPVPFYSNFSAADGVNTLQQRYLETMSEAGWLDDNGDMGAPETFREWLNNGPIYFSSFIKASDDASKDVEVNLTLSGDVPKNARLYIGAFNTSAFKPTITDGNVSAVASKLI